MAIVGRGFGQLQNGTRCHFGDSDSLEDVVVVSDELLRCVVPARNDSLSSGPVALRLMNGGVAVTRASYAGGSEKFNECWNLLS